LNLRAVGWLLGCILLLLAVLLLVPAGVSLFYGEWRSVWACLESAGVSALVGLVLALKYRGSTVNEEGRIDYFRREGLAAVGLSWLLASAVGALPFVFSGTILSPAAAFFESASGFTTTGSTILSAEQIDGLSRGMAFWRSFTHWLGGIGIVLVFVVLFPTGGRSLFRSEVPGIAREAVQSRVRDSAIALARVYVGLTLVQVALLFFSGLSPYEAFIHAFGTIATGGFSNHSESVAAFGSWTVEAIIVVFMFAAGVNFAWYDSAIRQGGFEPWKRLARSGEFRAYTLLILGSTAVVTLVLWFWGGDAGGEGALPMDYTRITDAFRDSLFAVVSLQTSTGYGTADFDRWPEFCRALLMVLAVIGASAGSTGGGIKVVRILILARASLRGVKRFARPRAVQPVRIDGEPLAETTVASVTGYCGLWALFLVGGTLALTAMGTDLVTAATGTLACLNNIGPGLELVGPSLNYAFLTEWGKLLLSLFMILGRLEFYAVVVLFVPGFWRR
jgi:trk system potassium uptake protein TrkH